MNKNHVTAPTLLVDSREAAKALGISPRKLWELTAKDEIPHVRIGRSVRYAITHLQRWIEEKTKGGAA